MMLNALSIDVEEYYHADIFQRGAGLAGGSAAMPAQTWPSRIESSTDKVLALLSRHGISATFFVVGEVAEEHPDLIRQVAEQGHEIGCHSHRHEFVHRMTPQAFRADVQRAKNVLENLTGKEVIGFRAPNFSIRPSEKWAYDILVEEGFQYDSSVFPIFHDRYGDPNAPRHPYKIHTEAGALIEFPLGTLRVLAMNFPISGGGYFRLFPTKIFETGIRHMNRAEGLPAMFYFHPWELDHEQPRPTMPWRHRFRHYVGMERLEAKLSHLFGALDFSAVRTVLGI